MSEKLNLSHVVVSSPSLLSLATTADTDGARRSWIQLAKTGSFVSNRYGKFAIMPADLRMMAANFKPAATPIDYDHLGMEPKQPGDGIAAGWLQRVEVRAGGNTLWGLVEWTDEAAMRIANREYKFISPSFIKDHTDQTGQKVGTKLLAAALTNFPFLPDMAAVTLASTPVFGVIALSVPDVTAAVHHLAEVGQRVAFQRDSEKIPELTDKERGQTFLVKSIVGEGDDQFVRLTTVDGREFGWFRATQLAPADAPQKTEASPLPEKTIEEEAMPLTDIETRAAQFALRVNQRFADTRDWGRAFRLAQDEDEAGAAAYRLSGVGADSLDAEPDPAPVLSLSASPGETFDDLAMRYASEKGVPLGEAVKVVGRARPDLASARG